MKRRYDLNGLRLKIEAQLPEFIAAIEQHVAPFATPAFDVHDYSISIEYGPADELPQDAEFIFEGEMVPGVPSRLAVKGDKTWRVVPGRLSILFEWTGRATRIRIGDGCDRLLLSLACIDAMDAALAASGQYLVHGAALALPGERSRALLVFAPSGAGKTTTALALALGGFGLMTDDAIVLQPHGYGSHKLARAWGLPRTLKVHRRTAELLPMVQPLLGRNWDCAGEQMLQTKALSKIASTVPPVPIPVAAIAILGGHSEGGHRFAPLAKAKALQHLAEDNLRCSRQGVLPRDVGRFAALGGLIATTPTFELRVGTPLPVLSDYVAAALSDLAQQT